MRFFGWWWVVAIAVSAANANGSSSKIDRLGTAVVPTAQSLELRVDARQDNYQGRTTIALRVKQATNSFRLHAAELELESVALTRAGKPITITFAAAGDDQLEIKTSKPLTPGGDYSLSIEFKNNFDTRANALYKLNYEGRDYTFSQFEDVQARRAFPCWDEPCFKLPYQITVEVPVSDLAVSNAPNASEAIAGDWKKIAFQATKPLPSYLLAIATGPFDTVPIPGMSVSGRVVVPKGKGGLTADAVKSCPPILAALESYFGQPYPFEKLDLLAVPEFWYGAMENPGAITFKDRGLLIDPASGSTADREALQSVLAHELAHMWFGDLVTMEWWDDLWLNESFANWMESKIIQQLDPERQEAAQQVDSVQSAFRIDSLSSTRAMRQPVKTQAVLLQAADALAYQKGEAVLQMFEQWIGAEKFRQGVLAYLKTHAWGNARGQDLWNALTKSSGLDVSGAMASFLDQPGVPLVRLQTLPDGKITLSQTRFTYAGLSASSTQVWRIPVTLEYSVASGIKQRTVMLDRRSMEIQLTSGEAPAWIHPNADERGYYRWSVTGRELEGLLAAREMLSLRERMGLGYALASQLGAGTLRGDEVLRSLAEIMNDQHPLVVSSTLGAIATIWGPLAHDAVRPALRQWLGRTMAATYRRIGPRATPGEDLQVTRLRPDLLKWLGAEARDPSVLALARQQVQIALADSGPVDIDLRRTFLALAAIEGDEALMESYRQKFESLAVPREKSSYLQALGEFSDPGLTRRALDYALAARLSPSDLLEIPRQVSEDPERQSIAWAWIRTNYDAVSARVPPFVLALLPWFASGCDRARLAEAKAFFAEPQHNVPGTDRSLAQVAEGVDVCATIREREGASVKRFLEAQ
ncbi:MAG: M1 family aminopeptidase [Acidobacteriota bacterium]